MAEPVQVYGYHGTTTHAATSILREGFQISRNEYDWLGDGVYFFQDAPTRAWEWATTHYGTNASVIGALIRLEDCMDLLDIQWAPVIADAYDAFLTQLKRANLPVPRQTSGAHRLDRAVLNYAAGVLAQQGVVVRTVRAAFSEGTPVFPRSALFDRTHVQIAIRDTSLIEASWIIERAEEVR